MTQKNNENRIELTFDELEPIAVTLEKRNIPINIAGVTGVGKTDFAISMAEKTDRRLIMIQSAAHDSVDFVGQGRINEEEKMVDFYRTRLLDIKEGERVLIFNDEPNRAPEEVQQALLGLYNSTPIVGTHLLKGDIWVISAFNDDTLEEDVFVSQMDAAQRTRCANIILKPSFSTLVKHLTTKYGIKNNFVTYLNSDYARQLIDEEMVSVYTKETFIKAVPRILDKVANAVDEMEKNHDDILHIKNVVWSLAGSEIAISFHSYLQNLDIFDIEDLFKKESDTIKKIKKGKNQELAESLIDNLPSLFNYLLSLKDKYRTFKPIRLEVETDDGSIETVEENEVIWDEKIYEKCKNLWYNMFELEKHHGEILGSFLFFFKKTLVKTPLFRVMVREAKANNEVTYDMLLNFVEKNQKVIDAAAEQYKNIGQEEEEADS